MSANQIGLRMSSSQTLITRNKHGLLARIAALAAVCALVRSWLTRVVLPENEPVNKSATPVLHPGQGCGFRLVHPLGTGTRGPLRLGVGQRSI